MIKNKFLLLFLFFISLFAITSCETVVELKLDSLENRLTVNCFINNEGDATATVSVSKDPLDDTYGFAYINDAQIDLFADDEYAGTFIFESDGYYILPASLIPDDSKEFRLEVQAPGYDKISSVTTMPSQIEITNATIKDTTIIFFDEEFDAFKIELEFTDPVSDNDHYSLSANYQDDIGESIVCFSTIDPLFSGGQQEFNFDDELYYTFCNEGIFGDVAFNGATKKITIYINFFAEIFLPDPEIILTLQHISNDYYLYSSSADLQNSTNDNPFAQPVNVYNNIDGGFGIFAAAYQSNYLVSF